MYFYFVNYQRCTMSLFLARSVYTYYNLDVNKEHPSNNFQVYEYTNCVACQRDPVYFLKCHCLLQSNLVPVPMTLYSLFYINSSLIVFSSYPEVCMKTDYVLKLNKYLTIQHVIRSHMYNSCQLLAYQQNQPSFR